MARHEPEVFLALKDIFVSLSPLLIAETNVVGLAIVSMA